MSKCGCGNDMIRRRRNSNGDVMCAECNRVRRELEYVQTERGRTVRVQATATYRTSDHGKAKRKAASDAYVVTEKAIESRKRYAQSELGRQARDRSNLKKRFGITVDQYAEMLDKQQGSCAICRTECVTGKRLAVDHCHETGRIRGLLCFNCNIGLGKFKDSTKMLETAIAYLSIRE